MKLLNDQINTVLLKNSQEKDLIKLTELIINELKKISTKNLSTTF